MKKRFASLGLVVLMAGAAFAESPRNGETPADRAKKKVPYVDTVVRFDWPDGGQGSFRVFLFLMPPTPYPFPADAEKRTDPIRLGLVSDDQGGVSPQTRALDAAARGLAAFNKGDYAKSEDEYSAAIQLEPSEPEHHINRAHVRLVLGKTDEVMRDFDQAIRVDPKHATDYREERAEAWFWLGQPQKAMAEIEEVIRLEPNDASNYVTRAMLRVADKNYDGALTDFGQAERLEPSEGHLSPLYLIHVLRRDGKAALAQLEETTPDATTDEQKYNFLSKLSLLCAMGEFDKAIAMADQLVANNSTEPMAWMARAWVRYVQKDYDHAKSDYDAALRLNPSFSEAYLLRSRTWNKKGKFHEALKDLDAALAINPDSSDALNSKAWILATCADPSIRNGEAAVKAARRCVSLEKKKAPESLDTLAAALAEHGDFAEAVRTQQEAISLIDDPKSKDRDGYRKRLASYQNNRPFRDDEDHDREKQVGHEAPTVR